LAFGAGWVRYQPYGLSFLDYVTFTKPHGRIAEMKAGSRHEDWRAVYRAALLEPNKSKTPVCITNAEKKIAARARELSHSGDQDALERSELNVATYALVALRNWLDWNENESDDSKSAVA